METYEQEQLRKDQASRDLDRWRQEGAYEHIEITNLIATVGKYRRALIKLATAEDMCEMLKIAREALE